MSQDKDNIPHEINKGEGLLCQINFVLLQFYVLISGSLMSKCKEEKVKGYFVYSGFEFFKKCILVSSILREPDDRSPIC